MADIEWILFSKNRTLQAKSCIISLTALSDVRADEITVLYVDSEDISYEPLKKEFACRFIRQRDFYRDVMDILGRSPKSLVCFMVDDLIFRDRFGRAEIENLMRKHRDLDCLSFRLGKNIQDGRPPVFKEIEPGIISWRTAGGLGKSWNYFWELSSSIYRKELVLDYLKRCPPNKITFPNPMEFRYYGIMPNFYIGARGIPGILKHPRYLLWRLFCHKKMARRMACYEKSRAFTQGVNLVASRNLKYNTYITPEKLHELFLDGYTIDFSCLKDALNTKPNAGRKYFRIVGPNGEKHPLSLF